MSPFEFFSPQRIVFGWGKRSEIGAAAASLGRQAWVVVGSRTLERSGAVAELRERLEASGVAAEVVATIDHEPLVADVDETVARVADRTPQAGGFLLPIGGGSAIDLAKAVAALAPQAERASVRDYLEGVGRGLKLVADPLPILAMPTTGGTGTEATKNAVISSYDPPFKKSLRDARLVPRVVVVDPELSVGVSAATTAWTGMDAITQLIEAYITRNARPLPQALCLEGLRLALPSVERAVHDGADREAREAMAQAALFSGMALANSGLGLAHGVAAALGVHCRVPHGLACAVMLPAALAANRNAAEAGLARLARHALGLAEPNDSAAAQALVDHVAGLCRRLRVPARLSDLGVMRAQLPDLVAGSHGNSLNGNPRSIDDEELLHILENML
ncbi:MAG: iron-containing alcohol dehydrogenase [Planctomycetaceae bacterium]|nr:iron-containing alcohol dehydrogenase [Planctomycetaceae bacterium]